MAKIYAWFKIKNSDMALGCKSDQSYSVSPMEFRDINKYLWLKSSDYEKSLIVTYEAFEKAYLGGFIEFNRPIDVSALLDKRGSQIIHPESIRKIEERNKELMKGFDELWGEK